MTGDTMVILRFKIHSRPEKSDELMACAGEIITPARAIDGVINFDIARVLRDPDWFIATAVYEDGAALERTGVPFRVHRVMAMLPESLVAPPERTIYAASLIRCSSRSAARCRPQGSDSRCCSVFGSELRPRRATFARLPCFNFGTEAAG